MDLLTRKDELAAVIAHEMAHVLARHSAESMTAAAVTLPLRIAAALVLDSGTGMFDAMHTVLVALPASRAAETEADAIGMHLAARACFQPSGMISMLTVRNPPLPSPTWSGILQWCLPCHGSSPCTFFAGTQWPAFGCHAW